MRTAMRDTHRPAARTDAIAARFLAVTLAGIAVLSAALMAAALS